MYTANKRQRKYRTFLKFTLLISPFLLGILGLIWFVFLRNNDSISSNFNKQGAQVAVVKPATKDFSNEMFKITLRSNWEAHGKQNPFSNQIYYEFQESIKEKEGGSRWLRVYVDTFPKDFALNRLLPISVVDNRIIPGIISDDCTTFTGSPLSTLGAKAGADTWAAKWQGVDFVCSMTNAQNYTGTASAEEGIGTTFINSDNVKHKYFFVFIDHNVRPDYTIFSDSLKTFQTL